MAITSIPGSWYNEYIGLSTDPKPYIYVPNGSEFEELDTGKAFKFDAENRQWRPWSKASGGSGGSGGSQSDTITVNVSLTGGWEGNDPYTQVVTITGYETTPNTRVDIVADDTVIQQMVDDGVDTIYIENDNNVFTAYAVGGKPSTSYNLTVVLTEV